MDWQTELAEDLTPRLDIDDADSEKEDSRISFARFTGPLTLGQTSSVEEVTRLIRPFIACIEDGPTDEEIECLLVFDTIEFRAWISCDGCRQSPIRSMLPARIINAPNRKRTEGVHDIYVDTKEIP